MDWIKVGELSAYLMIPIAGVIVLLFVMRKQGKLKRKNNLLIQFRKTSFKNEDELSWYIAHDIVGKSGFFDCVVYKVDHGDRVCRQIAAFGPKNPEKMSILNPINIPFERGIVGHVAAHGVPERINDTTKDSRYVPDDDVRYSEITVPIFLKGVVVMIIDSENKKINGFSEADGEFFLSVARITTEKLEQV